MSYALPVFNLLSNWYNAAFPPPLGPAQFVNVPSQLYYNSRLNTFGFQFYGIRIPPGSVNGVVTYTGLGTQWYVNCPAGSAKWFVVANVAIVHRGFPNEYWMVTANSIDPALLPAFATWENLP